MLQNNTTRTGTRYLLILIGTLLLARILFMCLMPHTYSKDLAAWLRVMDVLEAHGNPYGQTEVLNWPPFWMQFLYAIDKIAKYSGIPRWPLVQALLITGEVIALCITWIIGTQHFDKKRLFRALLWGMSLNPICIFLTCQHCNYDVFVGLWVALSAWMLIDYSSNGTRDSWLMACFFIGMGILTKTIPIILTPLLLVRIKELPIKTKVFGCLLLFTPIAIGMSILTALETAGVMRNVIGYRSLAGWYGFTGILNVLQYRDAMTAYQQASPILFIAVMIFTAWKCYHTRSLAPVQIILVMLLLLLFITTFGPGYSPPYILWYLPLLILLYTFAPPGLRKLITLGWIIGMLTYTTEYAVFGSHGAFLTIWFPSDKMLEWSDFLSTSVRQVVIRLPLFLFYLLLFVASIRFLRKEPTQPQQVSS
jgi:hypothetical protein